MKKILITILALTGGVFTTNAQDISFGVKAGINFANFTNTKSYDAKYKKGWTAGIVLEYEITDKFSIQPEVLYSTQGTDVSFTRPNPRNKMITDKFDAEVSLDYINVPILAKFYVFEGLSIDLGPQFAFLVDDSIDEVRTVLTNPKSTSHRNDVKLPGKKTFGIDGSVGIAYKLPENIFIQGRYNFGLLDVDEFEKAKNSVFQITLGYEF